jgi:hypothetical protein
MQAWIDLEFADGEYKFALPVPQINELQSKCGIGIGGLFRRVCSCISVNKDMQPVPVLANAEFYLADIMETIRQGLIGGGKAVVNGEEIQVTPAIANRLIANYVSDKPLLPNISIAASILSVCIVGYDPPKAEPAQEPATEMATAD